LFKSRGRRSPFRRLLDIFIVLFLVGAIVYLARDMLRSGRFTFLNFAPVSISSDGCALSAVPKEVVESWKILVRNSKTISMDAVKRVMAEGTPLSMELADASRRVDVMFVPSGRGVYWFARCGEENLALEVDGWTYGKWMETLNKYCIHREGKDGG
jgi:hypothetical protein